MPFSKTRGFQPRRTATLKGSPYTYRRARLSASPNGSDPKRVALHASSRMTRRVLSHHRVEQARQRCSRIAGSPGVNGRELDDGAARGDEPVKTASLRQLA